MDAKKPSIYNVNTDNTGPGSKYNDLMDTDDTDMMLESNATEILPAWPDLFLDPVLLNGETLGHGTILPEDDGMADAPFDLDGPPYGSEEEHSASHQPDLVEATSWPNSTVHSQHSFPPHHQLDYTETVTPQPSTHQRQIYEPQTPPFSEPSIPRLNATARSFQPGSEGHARLISPPRSHVPASRALSVGSEMLQEPCNGYMTPTSAASAGRRKQIFAGAADSPLSQQQYAMHPYPARFEPAPPIQHQPMHYEDCLAPALNFNGDDTGVAAVHNMQRWVENGPFSGAIPPQDHLSSAAGPPAKKKRSASHASQGSFACTQDSCPKTFATKAERHHHERYHGNKDHTCGVCGFSSGSAAPSSQSAGEHPAPHMFKALLQTSTYTDVTMYGPHITLSASNKGCSNIRSTTLLVILVKLAVLASAQPHGTEDFEHMEFSWVANMGSHFNAAVAHAQFAQMTSSPMSRTHRGSLSPHPPLPSREQSYQQPRSHPNQASSMDAYFSPFDAPYVGFQGQSTYSTAELVTNETSVTTPMVYERSAAPNSLQEITTDSCHSFPSEMPHRIERSLSPHTSNQQLPSSQYPAYPDTPLVSAAPTFAPQLAPPIQYPSQPVPIDHQPESLMNRNLEQFFPELNTPLQQPQMPRPVPLPHSTSFHATPGMLSMSDPMHISSEIIHNPNYQPGIDQAPSAGAMLGWIGRAPTIGQRTSMPTLKVDTNHLAPPNLSPLRRSPSSASSAGSSSRSPRRARAEMLFGDMHCHYCNAAFTTQGDLTHHLRSHQPYLSRNHVCQMCKKRFQYRKDLMRHLPRHDPNRPKFYCPFHGCKYNIKGFGRQDHLDRHVNTQHNRVDSPHDSRSRNSSNHS
ncbi:hypothetical protein AC578_3896 [Pseudocercospora eumusae]|uniref:C2H2 type master regulator of conidiophore development brlA n=1 Tax=Pseudocercospora eumusae TaxID=321146 RepID=A0A139GTT8_9PEZI|nr:hypothetical protein AC578_3896 [Pseudocercospora eumusae]